MSTDTCVLLTPSQFETFKKLIASLELQEVSLWSSSFRRVDEKLETKSQNNISINTVQLFKKDDPIYTDNGFLLVTPLYKFDIIINDQKTLEIQYQYRVVFKILDNDIVHSVFDDEVIKKYFLEHQLLRILWGFMREEISSGMMKSGIQPAPLPLLRN